MMTSTPLLFTDAALLKIKNLIDEENNQNLMLRVYITGGGCSGLQYGFTLDETCNLTDTLIEKMIETTSDKPKVKIIVDAVSLQYLTGAKVDYKEDISGAQFIIHNPQAKTQCGCGSSFSVDEESHD
ncbi:MAG: iron-sulfur cluster insertion protein ErpA [uncultured bacterium]|nr:MAG: iron-sulfur cluster insertion protein ErpA [uncultured bacterium]OGT16685.1 MAG: iron-sulfur cluster insertion protein ErpA [Gammaproteobacteria bacterium RIFCSPHIGHO2_02_FULL_38_33]OGT23853.1 MAG: iron-sulfur cluster insertion protein ErpA [Gammaproteobacteria bacterium RIFCSPHIGHO2_12_38_15]OGT69139.1 MAG: iron-sulfur cluster insertion protein ErpA [Gammaproteobacteria bacterium RIFCSPLOWO2_02_FULL_38_11]OGT77735.1 MAG: iron-sulfur cluster insertion protein ErpA [Gammaproteobacteria b